MSFTFLGENILSFFVSVLMTNVGSWDKAGKIPQLSFGELGNFNFRQKYNYGNNVAAMLIALNKVLVDKKMKRLNALAAVISLMMSLVFPVSAVETASKTLELVKLPDELTPQDIYAYLWDQKVVTVSRREQKISEVSASVTVITAEDIKRSGALNIYELLRPVVSMDVIGLTQTGPGVSIRGFNTALVSRTVLVLLNGNPMYQEVNMSPRWVAFPVTLQEIERIEIVRGPGSALWGANAYSGVINIITKTPDKSPAIGVSQSMGDFGTMYTNVTHAHNAGNLHYRLQYEGDQMHNVALNPDHFAVKRNVYKLDLQYIMDKQRESSLTFGYNQLHRWALIDPTFNMFEFTGFKEFMHFTYKNGDKWLKIRQNLSLTDDLLIGTPFQKSPPRSTHDNSIDIEVQATKKLQRLGTLTYGTEYKFVKAFHTGPQRTQGLGSIFGQHDIALNNKLSLVTGARVDTHPQLKTAFSPRVSVMYAPAPKHSLRLTAATSYRRPSFVELYANSFLAGKPFLGNEHIKAERMRSIESGYTLKVTEKTKMSITLFRNILDNFIKNVLVGGKRVYMNTNKATQNGAEWELETFLTSNLKGFVNYAFNQTEDTKTGGQFEMSPKHKANAGLGWMPKSGPYGNLVFNYVGDTGQTIGGVFKRVEPYRNVDVNFGYRFSKNMEGLELALGAQNVFNKKRIEQPAADIIKRRVVGTVSYAF